MDRRTGILVAVVLGLCHATVALSSPAAAVPSPSGAFRCRASAVRVLTLEPVVANPAGLPCRDESRTALDLPVASLALRALSARTQLLPPGGTATSGAQVAGVDLGLLGLRADLVEAQARVTCDRGSPRLTGTSRVVGLKVNGRTVSSADRADIPLGVGTLHLNRTIREGDTLVQRALELDTLGQVVILGEARAGVTGLPCGGGGEDRLGRAGTITVVKVASFKSDQVFRFVGELGPFTLRDDGVSIFADRLIISRPPGRYRITEVANVDNWTLDDVQCVDPDGGTTTDLRTASVLVDLDAGENVICTFTNLRQTGLSPVNGGDIQKPTAGVDPVTYKQDAPRGGGGIAPPSPPTPLRPGEPTPIEHAGASILPTSAVIGLPLLALLAGALWLFLVVAKRRRRDDESA